MNCPACGHTLSPGARFCNRCGTLVSQIAPATAAVTAAVPVDTACVACGKLLKPGVRFCTACGTLVPAEPSDAQPSGFATTVPADLTGFGGATAAAVEAPDIDLTRPLPDTGFGAGSAPVQVSAPAQPASVDFEFSEPSGAARSHLDGLPLHPIQRGVPDFEPPVPRSGLPPAAPVSFDSFDEPAPMAGVASAPTGGSGLKWTALAAVVIAVCGAAGWFGYRYVAGPDMEGVPAVGAEPAAAAAEGETVLSEPGEAVEAQTEVEAATDAVVNAPAEAVADVAAPAEIAPAPSLSSSRPVPVTVEPVHVLQDAPASAAAGQARPAQQPARRKPANSSLDSLLD